MIHLTKPATTDTKKDVLLSLMLAMEPALLSFATQLPFLEYRHAKLISSERLSVLMMQLPWLILVAFTGPILIASTLLPQTVDMLHTLKNNMQPIRTAWQVLSVQLHFPLPSPQDAIHTLVEPIRLSSQLELTRSLVSLLRQELPKPYQQ